MARQLRRSGFSAQHLPSDKTAWEEFLKGISRAYSQADQDRALIERSLRISSDEMQALHERLKQWNAELEVARAAAEAASASKSRFLANMSHEIRTPMNAILGFVELLLEVECPDAQRLEYGQTIRRNAQHLLTIIDEILDFSKIEAGHIMLERTPVDLAGMIEEVRSLMSVRAAAKELDFHCETIGLAGLTFGTDPIRVRQVVLNLVSNAIKFTASGSVSLLASHTPVEAGKSRVQIDVTDTGIGLSGEEIAALFQPFTQADASTTRKYGGTGLGLAISRRLAKLLDGDIEVRSAAGSGSTFSFWFLAPVEGAAPVENPLQAPAESQHTAQGLRVLLVEDGPDNQRLISHYLAKISATVQVADNGLAAVEIVTAAGDDAFDLILMDMQMPVMDGYTATARLRESGVKIPIIALTAHAISGDREMCIAAGCDDYCTKPISRSALLEMCAKWTNHVTTSASSYCSSSDQQQE